MEGFSLAISKRRIFSDLIFSVLQDFNKTPVKISGSSTIAKNMQ
jgi:hypothetical protein